MAVLVVLLLAASVVLVGVVITRPDDGDAPVAPDPARPGQVWSEEHGHWHDAP